MNQQPPQSPGSPRLLDAEERALAKALPRLHGRTAPGPDLDASILAAAEAAVRPAKSSQTPVRPRASWIAPTALAASMVLAVGMAWQLRPLPSLEAAQPAAESDAGEAMAARMIELPPAEQDVKKVQSKPAPARAPSPAPTQPATPANRKEQVASPAASAREAPPDLREAPAQVSAPAAFPVVSPTTLPIAPPAPAPPPPPAVAAEASAASPTLDTQTSERAMRARTSAPAAAAGASRDAAMRDTTSADKTGAVGNVGQSAPKAMRPAEITSQQARNEAEMAADASFVGDPDDIPPATAASPAVRDAWLHRIIELLEQGKRQEAEASLAEFRRRYPAAVLPPALRALEVEP